jgi:argininosuccinate lyase
MAQLWGGRFTRETDQTVFDFNASIQFDRRLYKQDIEGSIAHAKMLGKQNIITQEESEQIVKGLQSIGRDIDSGALSISPTFEDIHSFVEAILIERIGEVGKMLHTGRSRNDQVALDMRMFTRDSILEIDHHLKELLSVILHTMEENLETYMPGFTHMQKAQPITLAHHYGAYFEMFKRDRERLFDIFNRMNVCPLGAGALAGTTYPLDRNYTAELLHFYAPAANSIDAVSDRDYLLEYMGAMSIIMMHLSRFCEEIICWNSNEYGFVELDDAFSTGSSIMPQKKNPDIAELVKGKTGRVYGDLFTLMTTLKGLPLAYNKDMQEDKESAFDAMETTARCILVFTGMISTMRFHKERMAQSAKEGFTNATDAADYLVRKGIPFRDAHEIIGKLVLLCIEKEKSLDQLSLDEMNSVSHAFERDIYEAISLKTCVARRNIIGGPGPDAMEQYLERCKTYLKEEGVQLGNVGEKSANEQLSRIEEVIESARGRIDQTFNSVIDDAMKVEEKS